MRHFDGPGAAAARRTASGPGDATRAVGCARRPRVPPCSWDWRRGDSVDSFLTGRIAVLAATLAAATAVVFVIVQVVPGDPVRYMMGLQADPETVAAMRHQLGLDAAAIERYARWIGGLLRGDFGVSYTYRIPVGSLIAERLQVSLPLAVYALLLGGGRGVSRGIRGRGAPRPRERFGIDRRSRSWASRCRISGWECCW